MNRLVNIGFGNMVNAGRIVAVVSPDSAPSRRIIQNAREDGRIIDATQGRKTRSVVVTSDDHIVLSALMPETIAARNNGRDAQIQNFDDGDGENE